MEENSDDGFRFMEKAASLSLKLMTLLVRLRSPTVFS